MYTNFEPIYEAIAVSYNCLIDKERLPRNPGILYMGRRWRSQGTFLIVEFNTEDEGRDSAVRPGYDRDAR